MHFIYLCRKSIYFSQNLEIAQELKLYFRHGWRPCEDYFSYLVMSSTLSTAFVLNTCLFWRIGCELARLAEISLSSDFLLEYMEGTALCLDRVCMLIFLFVCSFCVCGCVCVGGGCRGGSVFGCVTLFCVCFFRNIHRACFSSCCVSSFTFRKCLHAFVCV